ncbi:MAG: glycosyltransferase family 4 protein [Dehalococcoidia bacterium]|nr:glycosyltransferase family 4 protein [Dehalococcoidia bacterium]
MNIIAEDRVGGPQMRILRMAAALKHSGVDTVVAIPHGTGAFGDMLEEAGVPYHRVPGMRRPRATVNPLSHLGWLAHLWGSIRRLVRLIRDEGISVVHQHDVTHVQGAIAGRLAGCGVVWHINGMPYPLVWKSFKPLVYLVPHVVAASSRAMGREYMGSRGDVFYRPVEVLYPPVDIPGPAEPGTRSRVRGELGIPEDSPMVVTVGNLYPTKGHLYFVRAAAAVKERSPEARFVVVGQTLEGRTKYADVLHSEARTLCLGDAMVFAGFRTDVADILHAADILVQPSLSESFGIAIAEGLAAGLPVVASDVGGVPEIVQDGNTGILVSPRDPEAIASAVVSLLEHGEQAASMAARGREWVREMFSPARCAETHERVYQQALRAAGRA